MKKSLKTKLETKFVFCGYIFLEPLWNWDFGTNMESNADVSLQLKDHLV